MTLTARTIEADVETKMALLWKRVSISIMHHWKIAGENPLSGDYGKRELL